MKTTLLLRTTAAAAMLALPALSPAQDATTATATSSAPTGASFGTPAGPYATLVIGDVRGMIDQLGVLASKVVPGLNGDVIRAQAGGMIQDPGLEGLPAGSSLFVVFPRAGLPYGYLEVAEKKSESYKQLMNAAGLSNVAYENGVLLAGADDTSINDARRHLGEAKSGPLASSSKNLLVTMQLQELLKEYDPQIQQAIDRMAQDDDKPTTGIGSPQSLQKMMRAYYNVAKQIDQVALTVDPSEKGLRFDKELTLVNSITTTGSTVATGPDGSALLKMLPANGSMRGEANFDPQTLTNVSSLFLTSVVPDDKKAEAEKMMNQFGEISAGSMGFDALYDTNITAASYAIAVKDEQAALAFVEKSPQMMEDAGIYQYYKDQGMPMTLTFEKNVREHAGVPIHHLKVSIDFSGVTDESARKMMEKFGNVTYEVAAVNKVLVYAVQPAKVEEIIDAVKSGSHPQAKPLVAKQNLASGGQFYADYAVGGAIAAAAAVAPEKGKDMLNTLSTQLKDSPPLQMAGYRSGDDKIKFSLLIPAGLIRDGFQAGQQVAVQSSQNRARVTDSETTRTPTNRKTNRRQ